MKTKFRLGDIICRKNPGQFDYRMSVERITDSYYYCNCIGKSCGQQVDFTEEDDYELLEKSTRKEPEAPAEICVHIYEHDDAYPDLIGRAFIVNSKSTLPRYVRADIANITGQDVYDIWRIYNEVCVEAKIFGHDETNEEVLRRFLEYKQQQTLKK